MSAIKGLEGTAGYIRIGTISSIDTDNFRCNLSFPGSYAVARDVPLTPSPLIGFMPEAGSNVAVFSMPGAGHRIISILDTPDSREPSEVLAKENKPGRIPRMETGDVYVGHKGRAYFNKYGDVRLSSAASRATIELKAEKALAEVYGYNFDLHTPGNNVRIRSKSTVDAGPLQTWGDMLSLEVNVPVAPPLDHEPDVLPTSLGRIQIDRLGNINASVMPLTPNAVSLGMNVVGSGSFGRGFPLNTVGMAFGATGNDQASLFTPKNSLLLTDLLGKAELSNLPSGNALLLSDAGEVRLGKSSLFPYFSIDASTQRMTMSQANGTVSLAADGSFTATDLAGDYLIGGTPLGLTMTGKTAVISATAGSMLLSSSSAATLAAPLVNLGLTPGGHVAFAEAIVYILGQLNILHQAIKTHTHVLTGVVTTGAGAGGLVTGSAAPSIELAAGGLIPPVPTPAQMGSTTVTAQV